MSTATRCSRRSLQRWKLPAACAGFAVAFLAVFLATGQVASAIWSAGIMLCYGAVLLVFSRRSDVAAILSEDGLDERRAAIHRRAAAFTFQLLAAVAVTMAFVRLAQGHGPGDWGTVCMICGGAYIGAVIVFTRRG